MTTAQYCPDLAPPPGPGVAEGAVAAARVIVVDDVPANVALLQRLLGSLGIQHVQGVTDPRLVVELCLAAKPDLVLLDLHMPHLDGYEVMTALRAALPPGYFLPVLVLTADASQATRERALRAGANDFLSKPFDRTEVLLRVTNLLHTRSLYAQVQDHNVALTAEIDRRAEVERRLAAQRQAQVDEIDAAVAAGLPRMVYQPIVALESGETRGVEALARFGGGSVRPPNEWFEQAEQVGRGTHLELVAVAAAFTDLNRLAGSTFMSVNVSPATALTGQLARLLDPLPAERIVLELTEHTPVDDYDALEAALAPLRRRGVRIAVDDTGAGYAGLRHLLRLRPDIIKLDVVLTQGVDRDPARRALAGSLTAFADEIGAVVIAEGIETVEELETLRKLGIAWGQGYHLARPGDLAPPVGS